MSVVRFGNFSPEESAWLARACASRSVFAPPELCLRFGELLRLDVGGGGGGGGEREAEAPPRRRPVEPESEGRGAARGDAGISPPAGAKVPAWGGRSESWDKRKCRDLFAADSPGLATLAPTEYVPHGLYNYGNTCFLNSVLHAILACRDVRNVFFELDGCRFPDKAAPVLQGFVDFSRSVVVGASVEELARRGTSLPSVSGSRGASFYPTPFEKILERFCAMTSGPGYTTPQSLPQQDAQEFLLHALDQLHEEMIALRAKAVEECGPGGHLGGPSADGAAPEISGGLGDEWEEVGRNNKSSVTRRHDGVLDEGRKSRISSIFGGLLRSTVRVGGSKPSVCIEPFTVLQLGIASEEATGLREALRMFSAPDYLDDYSKEGVASKTVQIEEPPLVLVIQLLRFTYTSDGRSTKITKPCEIEEDLVVGRDTLVAGPPLEYELFATVSHHGNNLQSGHYTACVRDLSGRWHCCDDDEIWEVGQEEREEGSCDVYLALYRQKTVTL